MNVKKIMLIVLTLLFPSSALCPPDSIVILDYLLNVWRFDSYSGGFSGGTWYPNYKYIITFEMDSNRLVFKENKSDSLFNAGNAYFGRNIFAIDSCWTVSGDFKHLQYLSGGTYSVDFARDSVMYLNAVPLIADGITLKFISVKSNSVYRKNQLVVKDGLREKDLYFDLFGRQVENVRVRLSNGVYIKASKINNACVVRKIMVNTLSPGVR